LENSTSILRNKIKKIFYVNITYFIEPFLHFNNYILKIINKINNYYLKIKLLYLINKFKKFKDE